MGLESIEQVFAARALAARKAFIESFASAKAIQAQYLIDCVEPNIDTAFGRAHGFDKIKGADGYRKAVPISTYDGLEPWIERAAAGEPHVLTRERICGFVKTSGSTGRAKKIPITPQWIKRQHCDGILTVWGNVLARRPEIASHPEAVCDCFWWDPTVVPLHTDAGHPWANYTQACQLWPLWADMDNPLEGMPGHRARWMQIPWDLEGFDDRMYYRLRYMVDADLLAMMYINPSSVVAFAKLLARFAPDLIRDVRDGTLFGKRVADPSPSRASELEAIAADEGRLTMSRVWPRLDTLWTWKSASAALYLDQLHELLPGSEALAWFYGCSEGPFIAIPVDDHPTTGPLNVPRGFFEFAPSEIDLQPDSETLLFDQLEKDKEYHVIFSRVGGMYRYSVGDVVRVVGFTKEGVPYLEFMRRRGAAASFTGEKLTEVQVGATIAAGLATCGLRAVDYTCFPTWGDPPYYEFVFEPETEWSRDEVKKLEEALEKQLGVHNDEYPGKRASHRLDPVRVTQVSSNTFAAFYHRPVKAGTAEFTVKRIILHPDASARPVLIADRRKG